MKKFFIFGIFSILFMSAVHAQFDYEYVAPKLLYVGDKIELRLNSTDSRNLQLLSRPAPVNGRWLQQTSQNFRSINGRSTYSVSFFIAADRAGTLSIPELKVQAGANTYVVKPFSREVKEASVRTVEDASNGGEMKLSDLAFGDMKVNGSTPEELSKRRFYVGEAVALDFFLYRDSDYNVMLTQYPAFELADAVFDASGNPENRLFAQPVTAPGITRNGRSFSAVRFSTVFYPLKPGKYLVKAENQLAYARRQSRGGGFFSIFEDRQTVPFKIDYPDLDLDVLPLPPEPNGTVYTGAVTTGNISYELPGRAELGEAFTLRITLDASFDTMKLKAPRLNLPGFRNYGGEIQESPGQTVFDYPLIPIKAGSLPVEIALTTFDPERGEYRIFRLQKIVEVAPGAHGATSIEVPLPADRYRTDIPSEPPPDRPDYQKSMPGSPVKLPLFENVRLPLLLLLILCPLAGLGLKWYFHHRSAEAANPSRRRLKRAQQQRPGLLRAIGDAGSMTELLSIATGELSSYLCNQLNLPPGSSPAEIAEHLRNPENAQTLRQTGIAAFSPDHDESQLDDLKSRLLKLVKTAVIVLLFATFSVAAQESDFAAGNAAFARGDYNRAAALYRDTLDPDAPRPGLLYNLANAEAAAGRRSLALGYLETAHLLSPLDDGITHNLNLLRRSFQLPDANPVASPADWPRALRSTLRPDQWMLVGAVAFGLIFLIYGIPGIPYRFRVALIAAGAFIWLGAWGMVYWQSRTDYSPNLAMLLENTPLRTLPSADQGSVLAVPGSATQAVILQSAPGYALVKCGELQGWVPLDKLFVLLPQGIF